MGHPLLHEIFKALLKMYPSSVFAQVRKYNPTWNLLKYDIIRTFEEVELDGSPRRFVDIIFLARKDEKHYPIAIFHEVKTGKYDLNEVVGKYMGRKVTLKWVEDGEFRKSSFYVNTMFIWAWHDQHLKNIKDLGFSTHDSHLIRSIRQGRIRLIPLEIVVPLLKAKLYEALDSAMEKLANWEPTNYSQLIKDYVGKKHRAWKDRLNEIVEWVENYNLVIESVWPISNPKAGYIYTFHQPSKVILALDDNLSSVVVTNVNSVYFDVFPLRRRIKRIYEIGTGITIYLDMGYITFYGDCDMYLHVP